MYKRTIVLGAASIIVSIITTIQFSHNWVYFGVFHFILFASWLALIFLPYPKLSLFIAIMILTGSYFGFLHTHALFSLLETPLHLPKHTKDLVPLFPWFSTILLGITLVGFHLEKMFFSSPLLDSPNNFNIFLSFMGRHALIIYLIHQPVLFAICYVFYIYSI